MNFEFKQNPISIKTAIIAAFLGTFVGFLMVAFFGYNPFKVFRTLFLGAFGSRKALASSLRWATPLMFTGVAAALAFKGGMFNFGMDGQLYIGSLAATIVALYGGALPGWLLISLMILVSMLFGALWAFIPAFVKVKLERSEIVPALMLNYVAIHLTDFLVHYFFLAKGTSGDSLKTDRIAVQAQLTNIVKGYQLTWAILLGLIVVFAFWILLKKTKLGYKITLSGENPEFSRYGGITVQRVRVFVMLLSGALAGLCGAVEIMSVRWRFESQFAPTLGNDGIISALLGSSTPVGTLIASLFMGALKAGSLSVERYTEVSRALTTIIQGIIMCFISSRFIVPHFNEKKKATKGVKRIKTEGREI